MRKYFLFSVLLIVMLIFTNSCNNKKNYDTLANCLSEKGAVMYGTEWCPHCQEQKARFGESFKFVNYVDCDYQRGECQEAGIRGYPTWVINGGKYPGVQSLEKLAGLSGCQL